MLADPRYTRAWPGGVGDRKMGSNYAPTIHVQREAASKGLQQVLWLYGHDHQLTEVGTMNIFMFWINDQGGGCLVELFFFIKKSKEKISVTSKYEILEKELVTPPLDGLILPGITRDSILRLARHWNTFKVKEEKFTMPQIQKLVKEERVSIEITYKATYCDG